MPIENGYVTWAQNYSAWVPGAQWRHWPAVNSASGLTAHSSEGHLAGAIGEMNNPAREVAMVFFVESWAGNENDGKLFQFFPVTTSVFLSSSQWANENTWGVEVGGFAGERFTPAAVATIKRLIKELETYNWKVRLRPNFRAIREGPFKNMYEHNEWTSTSCPSHRWDSIWDWLKERENDMTPEEVNALIDARLRRYDLIGAGVPTLKRLATAEVNRWSQLYAAAGKRFGKWKGARVASDPRNVPDYLEPED